MPAPTNTDATSRPRATSWLSEGLECLAQQLPPKPARSHVDFDVLIVGSGYGGAIAAATLAGAGREGHALTVGMLERGKEYLPGAFPARMASLAGHVRFSTARRGPPQGNRDGLFDVRMGPDVNALVANGLGGGSLINAGVMVAPANNPFAGVGELQGDKLNDYHKRARELLGARVDGQDNTIALHGCGVPDKYHAFERLAQGLDGTSAVQPAPLTVAMTDKVNSAGIRLDACRQCGDCATGCNYNAKESLDTNLLVKAQRQGARIYTGATVLRVLHEPPGDGKPERWCVHVVFTDRTLRARHKHPLRIYCRHLVLAAGTFGSTEILLRSRSDTLAFSEQLGRKFSSNGDMIAVAYGHRSVANAVGDENEEPQRPVGPTITGMLHAAGMLVEELAVPGPLRRLFEEIVTTANTLHVLGACDRSGHSDDGATRDPCAVDPDALRHSSILALMGNDLAQGALELTGDRDDEDDGDGAIRVRWPGLRQAQVFRDQLALLNKIGAEQPSAILSNPMWKLLPDALQYLLSQQYGPPLTVHPLGGCPMGPDVGAGVVNHRGQVYRAIPEREGEPVYATLHVLDGSIIPAALGANPALTIAAVALRAAEHLRAELDAAATPEEEHVPQAEEEAPQAKQEASRAKEEAPRAKEDEAPQAEPAPAHRPVFRIMPERTRAAPTRVEMVERMSGRMTLRSRDGGRRDCVVELTMPYLPIDLGALVLPQNGQPVGLERTLEMGPGGAVRIYDALAWDNWKLDKDSAVKERPEPLLAAPLTGCLHFFQREPSRPWQRVRRAIWPWLLNRGMRDTWQWVAQRKSEGGFFIKDQAGVGVGSDFWRRLVSAVALASRAGEVRLFSYKLALGAAFSGDGGFQLADDGERAILGTKRFTYGRASNPWHQLTRLYIDTFPSMAPGSPNRLDLDTGFLVNEDIPLLRILAQQDQPTALGDVAALGGYLLRLLLTIHMWSFRKPDTPRPRSAQRLPGAVPGLPEPAIHELEVGQLPDGTPVFARLTRYRRADMPDELAPVLLIHGYSASGSNFAHPAIRNHLAGHLWHEKRDVWILDMRTSSGMPHARHPWSLEDAALADIPAAVDFIVRTVPRKGDPPQRNQVDVVAHCIGAAMLSMAVLRPPRAGEPFYAERIALPGDIRRAVLSQVGPLVVFSQANVLRGYVMGYLNQILPLQGYTYRVDGEPTLADELLDRLLATMPYPDNEFHIENPLAPWRRTAFTGTRHRMDALYGRDFNAANIGAVVLENIDDFFGPLSIDTISQSIQMSRHKTIANRAGRNVYVSRATLRSRWTFETLSIHGVENGVADVATLGRMRRVLDDAGIGNKLRIQAVEGSGHQDWLIGTDTERTNRDVSDFLSGPRAAAAPPALAAPGPVQLLARLPHGGPVRSDFARPGAGGVGRGAVGILSSPVLHGPVFVAFVPVVEQGDRYTVMPGATVKPGIVAHAGSIALFAPTRDDEGWMTFEPPCAPPGAAGMLTLILYDASAVMDQLVDRAAMALLEDPRLRGRELTTLSAQGQEADVAAVAVADATPGPRIQPPGGIVTLLPFSTLLQRIQRLVTDMLSAVDAAIQQALQDNKVNDLRRGVLPVAAHDTVATGSRPSAAQGQIRFAVASCQYPAGILDKVPAAASYHRLADLLACGEGAPKPEFLILMGDQIYADATAGLFDPTTRDARYVRPYERWLSNEHVQAVLAQLPTFMLPDDHEIGDNFERDIDLLAPDKRLDDGLRSYLTYQRNSGVAAGRQVWTEKEINGFRFFLADTRTERRARTVDTVADVHNMDCVQWNALLHWLQAQATQPSTQQDKPCFIVSPSLLLPRRLKPMVPAGHTTDRLAWQRSPAALRCDAWEGYPASLRRLLATIVRLKLRNLVFLSGDEHISMDTTITIAPWQDEDANAGTDSTEKTDKTLSIRSIHSSALYAPYPFANSIEAEFEDDGATFDFTDPADVTLRYTCTVRGRYAKGDGYAVVSVDRGATGWNVQCRFDRGVSAAAPHRPAPA